MKNKNQRKIRLYAALGCLMLAVLVGLGVYFLCPRTITASDGESYEISVTYGPRARLPRGVTLAADELSGEQYDIYFQKALTALGTVDDLRAFDVRCVAPDGTVIEPSADVEVSFRLSDENRVVESARVLHFVDSDAQPIIIDPAIGDGLNTLRFRTDSFSVYAVVTTTLEQQLIAPMEMSI